MSENMTPELTLNPTETETAVPELTLDPTAVAEAPQEKPVEPVQLDDKLLTEQEKKAVEEFSKKIDITDTNMVLQYGAAAQKSVAGFSENALSNVRSKDLGEVGADLSELVVQLKGFGSGEEKKGLAGLFRKAGNKIESMKAQYGKVEVNVDRIAQSLEKHQITLMKDIAMFDQMYELNLKYYKELTMYILAGKKRLEEVRAGELEELRIKAEKTVETIMAADVNAELDRMRERNSRLIDVDRAAKNGDTALIDFEGFKDGVAFEGGKGENFPLNLGSGQFIPGFEEQVVGHKAGEEFEINVTFPEDYHAEDLKGQPVVFKVKVNAVQEKELPALDDEFAKDVSEFDTLADLKKDVKEKLQQEADKKAQVDMENNLISTVIENMEADIPQCMYENKINEMVNDFSYRLQSQGMSLDLYLHYTGSDMKSFRETFQESAERQVKIRLALEKIAEVENLTATPEEIDAEYEKIAKNYGIDVSRVKGVLPEKEVVKDVTVNKAIDLVKDSAEVTEKKVKKTSAKSKKKAEESADAAAEDAASDAE